MEREIERERERERDKERGERGRLGVGKAKWGEEAQCRT